MKIRMKDNTLRLRLSQSEVEQFGKEGMVSSVTLLGAGEDTFIRYSLVKDDEARGIFTTFSGNEISVLVPTKLAEDWASTERVGFEEYIRLNGNDQLYVLVEKDFQCLHKKNDEEETDAFPNSLGAAADQHA